MGGSNPFSSTLRSRAVADLETLERGGGPRKMKYKPPHSAAIFFWPIFTRRGGGMAPLDPLIRYCRERERAVNLKQEAGVLEILTFSTTIVRLEKP